MLTVWSRPPGKGDDPMALTGAEIDKLFDLLRELHGKDKPRDKRTAAIWAAVLEPWSYAQVRSAAVRRARENRYYPDPAELALLLPKQDGREGPRGEDGEEDRRARFTLRWNAEMKRRGQPPTLGAALGGGMAADDWWRLRGAVQLEDGEWMALLTPEQRLELRRAVEGG